MTDIKSLTLDELTKEMEAIGEKKFRAAQIYSWMHERLADDFDQMTNLSKRLREKLKENYELTAPGAGTGADVQNRWNQQISVPSVRWQCYRECIDEVSPWQFCLHLFSGRLSYGMPFLCIYSGWAGAEA